MNRLARLATLVRRVGVASHSVPSLTQLETQASVSGAMKMWSANFWGSSQSYAAAGTTELSDDYGHATGLEKAELDAKKQGKDLFHEAWLDAPFGTETAPVEVTSEFSERIVGVPDPDDDSLIWWGVIEEGQPPKQIIEGGEFFVLKKLPSSGHGH